jgi:hypothetical protein
MQPRRYEIGSDGRVVLVGLNSDETLEFERLDQSISDHNDHVQPEGQQSVTELLNWLELYHRHYEAMSKALLETDSVRAIVPSPPHANRFEQSSLGRQRCQREYPARPPQLKFVAMVLTGIFILFVAGVTLII